MMGRHCLVVQIKPCNVTLSQQQLSTTSRPKLSHNVKIMTFSGQNSKLFFIMINNFENKNFPCLRSPVGNVMYALYQHYYPARPDLWCCFHVGTDKIFLFQMIFSNIYFHFIQFDFCPLRLLWLYWQVRWRVEQSRSAAFCACDGNIF